ncbi:MAG: hypothetical protein KA007_01195 [Candidatus Pacebacteria bacterium]|nr:hypothetical protein [Candidatus Paceibacterota bacterium]
MKKICNKCKEEKDIILFSSNKKSIDGKRNICKECLNKKSLLYNKKSRVKNKTKIADTQKKYQNSNIDKLKKYSKNYREKNKQELTEKQKESYIKNKNARLLYAKQYRLNKSEEIKKNNKIYSENNKEKTKIRIEKNKNETNRKKRERYANDKVFNIRITISNRIKWSIKHNNFSKRNKTEDILGCSFIDFKSYLESNFESWMNWDNYGLYNGKLNYGWDIDHKIPLSTAMTEEDVIKLNHYTNLQPLCSKFNRDIKRDKFS